MTTTKLTLEQFTEKSHLPAELVRSVVKQFGGWTSFKESAADVCRGGIDGGFHGFIYNADAEPFARRNREAIAKMASAQADDFGTGIMEMIRGFGCFRNDTNKPTDAEIGSALYAGKDLPEGASVLNALAWYAGEEVPIRFRTRKITTKTGEVMLIASIDDVVKWASWLNPQELKKAEESKTKEFKFTEDKFTSCSSSFGHCE